MLLRDITLELENFSPLELQEDYDNSGLIIGNPGLEVLGILIALDITDDILNEALENNCNLIVSHHPLIFKGVKRFVGENRVQQLTAKAILNNIAVYAMHTNLDNSIQGLNAWVCNLLGINNCRILSPVKGILLKLVTFCPRDQAAKVRNALFEAGAGNIGNYDCCSYNMEGEGTFRASEKANPFVGKKNVVHVEPEIRIEMIFPRYLKHRLISTLIQNHPYEEVAYDIYPLLNEGGFAGSGMVGDLETPLTEAQFLIHVKDKIGIPILRHSGVTGKMISKVAVCTGSGSFLIPEATKSGADAFLTADLKYHEFFDVSDHLLLTDIGHYESERFAKDLIYGILIKKFPNFAFLISKINSNPVHYY
jgi:dinuclear metal center YbgI/SA1388 family protein